MWNNLPLDILAKIFSFLSPESLARANSACRHWHKCGRGYLLSTGSAVTWQHPPWFVAVPIRSLSGCCYVHNPNSDNWHALPLDFLPDPVRLISPVGGGLILLRSTSTTVHQLALCNPFTRQYKRLPKLNVLRTNPATGIVMLEPSRGASFPAFRVYVAGGMSDAPRGCGMYESTLEAYDSVHERWQIIGPMPVEFAVRLTVWTPDESVCCDGVLYWMTSARAYSIMGFEIGTNNWRELSVPLADQLEFAALILQNGRLTLVGGTCRGAVSVWELSEGEVWSLVEEMPRELGLKLLGGKSNWGSTKCVGTDGVMCLYRDLGSGMVVWREMKDKGRWEWFWVEGCYSIRGKKVQNFPIRAVLLHPNLAPSHFLN